MTAHTLPARPASNQFPGGCAFVDGQYVAPADAKISLFDWGFTRSDATYDVASVWQGAFFRLDTHMDRFFASLAKMHLSIPYSREQLREVLHGCVRAAGLRESYVAFICTRGVPPRGARDPRLAQNRFYAYAVPYVYIATPEKQAAGIDLHVSQRVRISPDSVDPTVKNYHWIDLVQSMFDAYDRGRDTSCVVDTAGNVAEGPGFNVFMVKDGVVHTTSAGVLEGVSRRTALELCARLGLPVQVAPVHETRFRQADEVFLTSTGGGVLPIAKLDGVPLPQFPGPVTQKLQAAYWALHDEAPYRDAVDYL
jgi:branched-chain amino acid aminotransferase